MTNQEYANEYAKWYGFQVFPLGKYSPNDDACKKPLKGSHGCNDGTTDPARIVAMFTEPDYNIALSTGLLPDGKYLVVVDIDPRHDGDKSWTDLLKEHPEIDTDTPSVRTGTGGTHYYYLSDTEVKNTESVIAKGIDTRGSGGYVVIPPSRHPNGEYYKWIKTPKDGYKPFPKPLLDLLNSAKNKSARGQDISVLGRQRGKAQPLRKASLPDTIPEGERNGTLSRYAYGLVRSFPPEEVERMVNDANDTRCKPPLDEREIQTILGSAESKRSADWHEKPMPLWNYFVNEWSETKKVKDENGKETETTITKSSEQLLTDYNDDLREQAQKFYKLVDSEGTGAMYLDGYPDDPIDDRHSMRNAFLSIGRNLDFLPATEITEETYLDYLQSNCRQYDRTHKTAEYPADPKTLYTHIPIDPRQTGMLRQLCDTFSAVDQRSHYRICAGILSAFVGRDYDGMRPLMTLVADERSAGKTTVPNVISRILQNTPPVGYKPNGENADTLGSRATIGNVMTLRDNLTGIKEGDAGMIAAEITSPLIATHRMYISHGSMPNHATPWSTFTSEHSLKADLLERALVITMTGWKTLQISPSETAERKRKLSEKLDAFVEQREEVLADIAWVFAVAKDDHSYIAHPKFSKWSKTMARLLHVVYPEVACFDFGVSEEERETYDTDIASFNAVFERLLFGRDKVQVSNDDLLIAAQREMSGDWWVKGTSLLSRKVNSLIPSLTRWTLTQTRSDISRGWTIERVSNGSSTTAVSLQGEAPQEQAVSEQAEATSDNDDQVWFDFEQDIDKHNSTDAILVRGASPQEQSINEEIWAGAKAESERLQAEKPLPLWGPEYTAEFYRPQRWKPEEN